MDPTSQERVGDEQSRQHVTELSSTGSVLGTFGVGLGPLGVAVDPTNGHIWVTNYSMAP